MNVMKLLYDMNIMKLLYNMIVVKLLYDSSVDKLLCDIIVTMCSIVHYAVYAIALCIVQCAPCVTL